MPRFSLALVLLALVLAGSAYGQERPSAAEEVDNLKLQLLEVQGREESLKLRLQELEEALKPENIERSLAGVGSTRPEELREARRRQLTIERDGVLAQLKVLETSRTRLETQLGDAQARAYHESARPAPDTTQALAVQSKTGARWLIIGAIGLFALALIAGLVIYQRAVKLR